MAKAIEFTPAVSDRARTNECKLHAGVVQQTGTMLATIAVLQEAHEKQVLDLLRGAMGAKDAIASILADLGAKPATVNTARNLITLARAMGAIDPELVSRVSASLNSTVASQRKAKDIPSLWQLWKRARQPDVRRGMSLFLEMAGAVGRAVE